MAIERFFDQFEPRGLDARGVRMGHRHQILTFDVRRTVVNALARRGADGHVNNPKRRAPRENRVLVRNGLPRKPVPDTSRRSRQSERNNNMFKIG